jgi:hypothetical protein
MCNFPIFGKEKSISGRGGKPNKYSMSEELTTNRPIPPPKLYASFVSPVLKVKMHAGLGSANGFAPAILHRMERLVKGPTQLKAGELAR